MHFSIHYRSHLLLPDEQPASEATMGLGAALKANMKRLLLLAALPAFSR
jgi:hypothetical protein